MSLGACIPDLVAQGKLTPEKAQEAAGLFGELEQVFRRQFGDQAAAAMASDATIAQMRAAAALKRRQSLLQVQAQKGVMLNMRRFNGGDPSARGPLEPRAASAIFDADSRAPFSNVEARRKAIKGRAHGYVDKILADPHRNIAGNVLDLPYPLGKLAAITAGSSKSLQGAPQLVPGSVVIKGNVIRYLATPGPGNATAILLREDDFNSSAVDQVRDNRITGPFATGISVVNASANIGVTPHFDITGNRFADMAPQARLLEVKQEGAQANKPAVQWDTAQTRNGRTVSLNAALR